MPRRLVEAAFELTDAAHFACQSQLADHDQAVRHWPVDHVADDRQRETEVGGRLRDPDAARHAHEDVRVTELESVEPLLQDGEDHGQRVHAEPGGDPAFVACPTRKIGTRISFARRMSRAADSRTWVTLPALPSKPASLTVWIESTIASAGDSPRMASQIASRSFSGSRRIPGWSESSLSARIRTCCPDSSPET